MYKAVQGNSRRSVCAAHLVILVVCCFWQNCQGENIIFVSEPRDMIVAEGETVTFECTFNGSSLTPYWRINNVIYFIASIPPEYILNVQDFSLTVRNVTFGQNCSTFQCVVGRIASAEGKLIIQSEDVLIRPTGAGSTTEATMSNQTDGYSTSTTTTTQQKSQTTVPEVIAIIVSTAIIIFIFGALFFLIILIAFAITIKIHKKKVMLPITTEENDAYEVVERVQREASISVLVKKHNMSQLVHREGNIMTEDNDAYGLTPCVLIEANIFTEENDAYGVNQCAQRNANTITMITNVNTVLHDQPERILKEGLRRSTSP